MGEEIIGAVFPVPHQFIQRLASDKKDVFVKFGLFRFLSEGKRLVFYDSGIHMLVGESEIKQVISDNPERIWRAFGPRIFLEEKEFREYSSWSPLGPRSPRKNVMTACVLKKFKKYARPKKPEKRVSPMGYYLRT